MFNVCFNLNLLYMAHFNFAACHCFRRMSEKSANVTKLNMNKTLKHFVA